MAPGPFVVGLGNLRAEGKASRGPHDERIVNIRVEIGTLAVPMTPPKDAAALDSRAPSQGGALPGPLVSTKLQAPASVSAYRERPRLSAVLDRGLEDSTRLTLLSAPPGYGKTVAVVGWLQSRGVAHAWLSLDAVDNDLSRFTRYLSGALGTVRPAAADATADLFGPGATPSPELVSATLIEGLIESDDPFALVIDDYQLVTAEPVHRLGRALATQLDCLTLVVTPWPGGATSKNQ